MTTPSPEEVTQLLHEWRNGEKEALDKLLPVVYKELRRLAASYLRRERSDHTLQATALVNEAYLRLVDIDMPWQNRAHFFAVAAQLMRRILVDHARGHRASKRGSGEAGLPLDEAAILPEQKAAELLALDDALKGLATHDPRKSQIVELRFFGGLTAEEIAEVLAISPTTVTREVRLAEAWLYREIKRQ